MRYFFISFPLLVIFCFVILGKLSKKLKLRKGSRFDDNFSISKSRSSIDAENSAAPMYLKESCDELGNFYYLKQPKR